MGDVAHPIHLAARPGPYEIVAAVDNILSRRKARTHGAAVFSLAWGLRAPAPLRRA